MIGYSSSHRRHTRTGYSRTLLLTWLWLLTGKNSSSSGFSSRMPAATISSTRIRQLQPALIRRTAKTELFSTPNSQEENAPTSRKIANANENTNTNVPPSSSRSSSSKSSKAQETRRWNFNLPGESPFGMRRNAEVWNSRVAMVRAFVCASLRVVLYA